MKINFFVMIENYLYNNKNTFKSLILQANKTFIIFS